MRLDELRDKTDEAADNGMPPEYEVTVSLGTSGGEVSIAWIEIHSDGLRIHLEM